MGNGCQQKFKKSYSEKYTPTEEVLERAKLSKCNYARRQDGLAELTLLEYRIQPEVAKIQRCKTQYLRKLEKLDTFLAKLDAKIKQLAITAPTSTAIRPWRKDSYWLLFTKPQKMARRQYRQHYTKLAAQAEATGNYLAALPAEHKLWQLPKAGVGHIPFTRQMALRGLEGAQRNNKNRSYTASSYFTYKAWLEAQCELEPMLKAQHYLCAGCHKLLTDDITVDHIVPRSRGGAEWAISNLQLMCHRCNTLKNDRTPQEWQEHKRRTNTQAA